MPNILLVSTNGAGFDTVDVADCTAAGVLVVNQSGSNSEAVAVHELTMLLVLARRLIQSDRALRGGSVRDRRELMGDDVDGAAIDIVGLGNIGSRLGALCRSLGMQVIACDPHLDAVAINQRGAVNVPLDELLRRADFVSINCPLDETTRGMIGAREFDLMQPHACFISTARGMIHDERALTEALRENKIAGAGLDVWHEEPPPADHPLLQLDNVIASPRPACMTRATRANMGRFAAEQLITVLDGKRPPRIVNPQVWPTYVKRFAATLGFVPQE